MPVFDDDKLNIISCPSCSRVENERFVELAEAVKEMTVYAERHALTIAVMGCRVNGPGETDDADLGLWCGPTHVNLKRQDARRSAPTPTTRSCPACAASWTRSSKRARAAPAAR